MITASQTKTPYCVTITNGDTSVYSDVEKRRHFVPMNFYVQLMPLVFISLYANCWIKKNYLMNK